MNESSFLSAAAQTYLPKIVLSLCLFSTAAGAQVEHGGFTVSTRRMSEIDKAQLSSQITSSTIDQLRLIEALALPSEVHQFFQSVDITYDPNLLEQAGVFDVVDGRGEIRVPVMPMNHARPVVLHELLHAFHYHRLGLRHPEVTDAFDKAFSDSLLGGRFRNAYFLSNPKEFFAVTASIYLVGKVQQPPFTCSALQRNKTYLAFLRSQFGDRKCGN